MQLSTPRSLLHSPLGLSSRVRLRGARGHGRPSRSAPQGLRQLSIRTGRVQGVLVPRAPQSGCLPGGSSLKLVNSEELRLGQQCASSTLLPVASNGSVMMTRSGLARTPDWSQSGITSPQRRLYPPSRMIVSTTISKDKDPFPHPSRTPRPRYNWHTSNACCWRDAFGPQSRACHHQVPSTILLLEYLRDQDTISRWPRLSPQLLRNGLLVSPQTMSLPTPPSKQSQQQRLFDWVPSEMMADRTVVSASQGKGASAPCLSQSSYP